MKRLILTLVAALALCLLVGVAAAAPAPESDFTFDPITGTITEYTGTAADVEVHASIGGVTVKAIGDDAFKNNTALEKVSLPSSVTSIGKDAFSGCSSLKSIDIPGTLVHLGSHAFYGCQIKDFDLTVDMDTFEKGVFVNSGIETLVIQGRLNEVPKGFLHAVGTYEHVRSVTLPEGVTRIGSTAFAKTAMTSFTIPSTVTTIGKEAFAQSALRSITIPPSVQTIEAKAFACPNLTSVVFSEGLESIGSQAFLLAPLETVTLPASLTSLELMVFGLSSSSDLKSVTFKGVPASVSKDAFMWCNNLEAIHVPCSWNQCEAFSFINSPDLAVTRQHSYGGWHTVNGQERRDCLNNCGAYETRPLPAVPVPKTGDEATLGLWLALICLSVSGMVILLRKKQHV